MTEPCKACLTGAPNHRRQRVITREDGVRLQVCERCGQVIAVLDTQPTEQSE